VAGVEAYLHDKFHLDPSTIHQRRRQTGYDRQTATRTDNGPIAQGEQFHKRSPNELRSLTTDLLTTFSSLDRHIFIVGLFFVLACGGTQWPTFLQFSPQHNSLKLLCCGLAAAMSQHNNFKMLWCGCGSCCVTLQPQRNILNLLCL